jgi:polyisoprenoid-binding protein YceI
MRYIFLLFVGLAQVLSLVAQTKKVRSAMVTFEFPAKEVKGSIEGFESQSEIDWDNPSNSIFKGSVATASLDTNNGLRNWALRGSRYFDAKDHPKISFASKKVIKTGDLWTVMGDLTIKGITKPFQIEFETYNNTLIGRGELYSSDFDVKIKKARADNLVTVKIEMELMP